MANFNNRLPKDVHHHQNERNSVENREKMEFYENFQQQQQQFKVIKPLGTQAGLAKSDFDITLDENSQQWFNHINNCFKQCEFSFLSLLLYATIFLLFFYTTRV